MYVLNTVVTPHTTGYRLATVMDQEQYRVVSSPRKNAPKKKRALGLRISSDSTMGGRKYQEDKILISFDRKDDADYACLCVFDGHGGDQASIYARDHLWENIKQQEGFFSRNHEEVMKAIRQGFHFTQSEMWKVRPFWPRTASGYASTAGTTVSMAIICGNDMYIAHLGDSRIAIGRKSGKGIDADVLTRDHKPSLPRELDRIHKAGGKVQKKSGVDRVVWTRTKNDHQGPLRRSTTKFEIPFLAVSRSLGDLWSYNFDSCKYIVSPDPEIWHHTIDPEKERFLILASDGLWNVASVYDCVNIVHQYNVHRINKSAGPMKETISHKLVKRGMDLWNFRLLRADNITVITCFFEIPETLDDEDDQLELNSPKDWAKAGLRMKSPHPEGISPIKPPLRRRQACPKLSSLENYNMDYCRSGKEKRRSRYLSHWFDGDLHWHSSSRHHIPKVKTCSCSRVKDGIKEVQARARNSNSKNLNKIMYARPTAAQKRPSEEENNDKSKSVKRLKLDQDSDRRDSIQAASSPDSSYGDCKSPPVSSNSSPNTVTTTPVTPTVPCPAGDDCVNSTLNRELPPSSPPLENSPNAENVEVNAGSSSRRRRTIRRSPRIQAAALTIPKSRRSCRIR